MYAGRSFPTPGLEVQLNERLVKYAFFMHKTKQVTCINGYKKAQFYLFFASF